MSSSHKIVICLKLKFTLSFITVTELIIVSVKKSFEFSEKMLPDKITFLDNLPYALAQVLPDKITFLDNLSYALGSRTT